VRLVYLLAVSVDLAKTSAYLPGAIMVAWRLPPLILLSAHSQPPAHVGVGKQDD
jgi:hypothetical protein